MYPRRGRASSVRVAGAVRLRWPDVESADVRRAGQRTVTAFDRRQREVDGGLSEVELSLGQSDVLDGVRRSDRDDECIRIGIADVLGGEDHQPAGHEARVFARLEHRREVVDGGVRIGPTHRLDECGRDVVVTVAGAVVDKGRLRGILDMVLGLATRARRLPGEPRRGAVRASPPDFATISATTASGTSASSSMAPRARSSRAPGR
jgi:hypothetical protein